MEFKELCGVPGGNGFLRALDVPAVICFLPDVG